MTRSPGRTVQVEALRLAAAAADASLEVAADARHRLLDALQELASAGEIVLPVERGTGWDRTRRPALPIWVRKAPARPSPPAARREPVRPPELRAVDALFRAHPPGEAQRALVDAVHVFLRDGRGPFHSARRSGAAPVPVEERPAVPFAERSLELTGDEKYLDQAQTTRLFTDGILTPELLRAYTVSSPLGTESLGPGPVTLLVENVATFHSLVRRLRAAPGPVGSVVLGGGSRLAGVLRSLADRPERPLELRYFGDLDPPGVRFPGRSDTAGLGLPPLLPAVALYTLLVDAGTPRPDRKRSARAGAAPLDWLPAAIRSRTAELFASGERLAQEWVGYEQLVAQDPGMLSR
ncbi:hypothetical protein ACL02T_26870 [Pseudonocardia sp. RS010]|uniref:hypothetical protein n=1 Tax=Pseudonocardia sp. RS010 TaxID=3385979 RepID=UPI0039A1BE9F